MLQKLQEIIFQGKFKIPYKIINLLCYYILPVVSFGILFFMYLTGGEYYEYAVEIGEKSWAIFIGLVFLSPLVRLFSKLRFLPKLLPLRKQFGVAMFWTFMVHAVGTAISQGLFSLDKLSRIMVQLDHYLFWGILAGIIIFVLGVTSNNYSIKLLKRNWKRLHYLTYPAFVMTGLHIYFIVGDIEALIAVIAYTILKILVFCKVKF